MFSRLYFFGLVQILLVDSQLFGERNVKLCNMNEGNP